MVSNNSRERTAWQQRRRILVEAEELPGLSPQDGAAEGGALNARGPQGVCAKRYPARREPLPILLCTERSHLRARHRVRGPTRPPPRTIGSQRYRSLSEVTGGDSHGIHLPRSTLRAVNASAAPKQVLFQRREFGLVLHHAQVVPLRIVIVDMAGELW